MSVVAIIQARMSSSRLPGKVFLNLAGQPIVEHVLKRVSLSSLVDRTVLATSVDATDDILARWVINNGFECFRGSLNDVLDRYYKCASKFRAKWVVRVTSDCPLVDPDIIDKVLTKAIEGDFDAFGLSGDFPDGLDVQVFKYAAIEKAWKDAEQPFEREHVGPYIEITKASLFKTGGLELFNDLKHMRWTLDEPRDMKFLEKLFEYLPSDIMSIRSKDVLSVLEKHPELLKINSGIIRNEGLIKSMGETRFTSSD